MYVEVRKHFDKLKRNTDHCICGLQYNNQVAEIVEEMGLLNDPDLLDRLISIVSANTNCVSLEEMYVLLPPAYIFSLLLEQRYTFHLRGVMRLEVIRCVAGTSSCVCCSQNVPHPHIYVHIKQWDKHQHSSQLGF